MTLNLKLIILSIALAFAFAFAQPTVDGVIAEGEYANSLTHEESGTVVSWTVEGDVLFLAATMASRGWAGIGFANEISDRKQGFDQYIVTMENDAAVLHDMYQAATRNAPEMDEDEGGSNNILEFAGVHDGETWVFEFSRPLDTGEDTDVVIVPGTPMIVAGATAPDMDLARRHDRSNRGGAFVIEAFVF